MRNVPDRVAAPKARKNAHQLSSHGDTRTDEYYWMRDHEDPELLGYLNSENEFTASCLENSDALTEKLYGEIRSRIREDRNSVPSLDNGYWYSYRYESGDEYPVYLRRANRDGAENEVILDVRELARGHEFTSVGCIDISLDNRWLLYAIDHVGRRLSSLFVVDLQSGETFSTGIENASTDAHWANDNATIVYTVKDCETLRDSKVFRLRFSPEACASPHLIYEERDPAFYIEVGRTRRGHYLTLCSSSTVSTEYRLLDAFKPESKPQVFLERERDHEYYLDYDGEDFYLLSNKEAKNFRMVRSAAASTKFENWVEVVAHRDDTLLEDFELFESFIALEEKAAGLTRIQLIDRASDERHYLDFGEQTYSAWLHDNDEYKLATLRFGYESMTRPDSIYDYDVAQRERVLLKRDEVLDGYDSGNYDSQRDFATARDGTRIPLSVVYRKDTPLDGTAPLLIYGYGSYGYSMDPGFSYSLVSLLDRGFVYALAHIRGGSDMGRDWYDQGRLKNKKNTFYDFIDSTEYLLQQGFASPEAVYAMGGSAGGLLVGAVVNMRPELYRGIVAAVPFVDVVSTMLDDSIPLTSGEYDEWGNPSDEDAYRYMLSYSPYDNVAPRAYPHLLATTGINDSQVQCWEPAKWVSKLRDCNTSDSMILLKTNMEAGHGGASGRFERIRETAFEYAFLIRLEEMRLVP